MKIVTAIIKPFKLEEVNRALLAAGFPGVTVSETRGFGRQMGPTRNSIGAPTTMSASCQK